MSKDRSIVHEEDVLAVLDSLDVMHVPDMTQKVSLFPLHYVRKYDSLVE